MSQLTSILLAPYNFLFGEGGIFASSARRRNRNDQSLYLGLPAIVFGILGVLFLIVGELNAGKTLIQRYKDNVEELRKNKSELSSKLNQELKMARATQEPIASNSEISSLRNQLLEQLDSEQILLNKLYSLAPDEPKHMFDLAKTFLTKSDLTLLSSFKNKKEASEAHRNKGVSIMKRIAPLDKPGLLEAHLFLANQAINRKAQSKNVLLGNIRFASEHLDKALIRDQENTTALGMKVLIAQKTGQTKEAKKFLEKLFLNNPFVFPQLCQTNSQLGVSEDNLAVLHSAQEKFSSSVARMPGPSERRTRYLTYLVECLHRLENIDDADKQVKAEMEEFSDNEAIQRWGKSLLSLGCQRRYEAASPINAENATELVNYLREGHRLNPNNVSILNYIVALGREDIPGLEKISKEIYQPGPKAPASVENILGTIALKKKNYFEAVKQFSKANDKAPNNAEYLNNLSYVYLTRPDPDPGEALIMVDKAIRSVRSGRITNRFLSNFFDTKGRALLALGRIAEENGDQELAESRYTAAAAKLLLALKDRPDNLKITKGVAECYEAVGQTEQVKVWSERVKQLEASETAASETAASETP